jgi:hypothetical protein
MKLSLFSSVDVTNGRAPIRIHGVAIKQTETEVYTDYTLPVLHERHGDVTDWLPSESVLVSGA